MYSSDDSDTEDYSSDFTEESECSFGSPPCRPVPQPIRRLVDIAEPSSAPKYNFTVSYNERVPTGSRIEIAPDTRIRPFKPNAPLGPADRYQEKNMWGGPFGTHDRTEMAGIDRSSRNDQIPLEKFSPSPYPFASQDGFNTKTDWLGGIGPVPHFGSRVKQGLGDISQQILERYNGARGFKKPKREVELSHPRNRQLPIQTPDFEDWKQRAADSVPNKKPFELPFQQSRDTGDRTMPFGGEPLKPPLRIMPTAPLRNSKSLPARINNIPTNAQPNPNGFWMQGSQPPAEMREPMFDFSDAVRTPAPVPNDAYKPPQFQSAIRAPVTNRSDTNIEWYGPAGNSSAWAPPTDPNFAVNPKISPEETQWLGNVGAPNGVHAPGHVAAVPWARPTQRDGNDYIQPGPAFAGGQAPMPVTDIGRPTMRQTTEESTILPRIVRSDIGAPPVFPTQEMRTTLKQTIESSVIMAPMQNTGPSNGPLKSVDQFRPTLREGIESLVMQPIQQLPQGGAPRLRATDEGRPTLRQDTEQMTIMGNVGGEATGKGVRLRASDEGRETNRQFMAETPELGQPFNSTTTAGGYLVGDKTPGKMTQRNMGEEETPSFGPLSSEVKAPMDRTFMENITLNDKKELGIYNRIPGPDRFTGIPRVMPNFNLPPDDRNDSVRTANPNLAPGNQGRVMPNVQHSVRKECVNDQNYNIQPYLTSQLRQNPYANDIRIISGQPQY